MIQTIYIRFQGRIQNPVRHLRGCFVEIINGIERLTIFIKRFILNICQGSKYRNRTCFQNMLIFTRFFLCK